MLQMHRMFYFSNQDLVQRHLHDEQSSFSDLGGLVKILFVVNMPRFGYDPQVRQDVRQDMRQEVRQEVRQKVKQEVRQQTICRSRFYCVYIYEAGPPS
jgi:hypothetical protein